MYKNRSYAKINLDLNILNKRKDGYHNIQSVMTNVNIYDELSYQKNELNKFSVNSNFDEINNEDNLVIKVSKYMFDKYNLPGGLDINIDKNIPIAAGMAGGSSNAASTIKAINEMFKLNLTEEEMVEIGITFGSDIPFCILGNTVLVENKGEKLTRIKTSLEYYVLVIKNNFPIYTKDVFNNIKEFSKSNQNDKLVKELEKNSYSAIKNYIHNDLEVVTKSLSNEVKEMINNLKEKGYKTILSGSGPTVLCFFENEKDLETAFSIETKEKNECFKCKNLI